MDCRELSNLCQAAENRAEWTKNVFSDISGKSLSSTPFSATYTTKTVLYKISFF